MITTDDAAEIVEEVALGWVATHGQRQISKRGCPSPLDQWTILLTLHTSAADRLCQLT